MLQLYNDEDQIGIPHWYFGKTKARTPTKLLPIAKDSLALSEAHEWGYEKERLWSTRDEEGNSSDEKEIEPSTRRRSSNISLKDVNSRTTQLIFGMQGGKRVPKLKEPRSLYCVPRDIVHPRWPVGIESVCGKPDLTHAHCPPPFVEEFYKRPSGTNFRLLEKADTDKHEGNVVYQLPAMRFPFYTRSRPTAALEMSDFPADKCDDDVLRFESKFECGNLFRARKVGPYEYELELRWDYFTMKHTQWFYFRCSNTRAGPTYKFTIINLLKSGSLYNEGMKPLFYSEKNAKLKNLGWLRTGQNIHYYKNNIRRKDCKGERYQYSLTWQFQFPHNGDVGYFAHCYPYSYTDLQKDLLEIANDAVKSQYVKQRILCHSLGGNMVHLLTVTTPSTHLTEAKQKRAVVVTARVHPGETNSSYMMRGFINFITGPSPDAKVLRDNFVFKIVPMLNPDGVVVGNYRSSLAARDLNRNYKNPIKDAYPSIWSVKAMIRRMLTEREVVLYCDLHGHSRKMNVFMYGCENKDPSLRLQERVFPNMMGRNTSKFKYSSCRFKVQKKKEGTGRIVMWQQMGILNSFTMEATFAGYNNIHFNSRDLEDMGYHFCDTLLDYCDPDTSKVEHVLANLTRIVKAQYAAKLGKSIDDINDVSLEDLDISDLESSDGGSDSSVSDGPPKLPLLRKKCATLQSKKKYKTRKERNMIHRQSKRRNSKHSTEPTKSTSQQSTADSGLKKDDKLAKPKVERRGSVSSTESPSLAKQTHGVPKHAQERVEERQAKVNKDPNEYPILTAGIFHPASSRDHDSCSPVCQRSANSGTDSRKSLEPAKVAFSTKETDVVYAVLEPTEQAGEGAVATLEQDGVHMSVMLSGVGNTYQHSQSTEQMQMEQGSIQTEVGTIPYSVNYRNSDVNSRRLGKNTFAIRPTKSAHRSHRSKQMLPSTKSEVLSTEHTERLQHIASRGYTTESRNTAESRGTTLGVSSPMFGRTRQNLYSSKAGTRPAQSWHSSVRPTNESQPLLISLENNLPTPRDLMKVISFQSPEKATDNFNLDYTRSQPVANFASSYVDKLLNNKVKRHSVPKPSHHNGVSKQSDQPPRRHRSLASLQRSHPMPYSDNRTALLRNHVTEPSQTDNRGTISTIQRTNHQPYSDNRLVNTNVEQKRLKRTSLNWDVVKTSAGPGTNSKAGLNSAHISIVSPSKGSTGTRYNATATNRHKGNRLGFRPQKL